MDSIKVNLLHNRKWVVVVVEDILRCENKAANGNNMEIIIII